MTAFTPGSFSAFDVSIFLMRGMGMRRAQDAADELARSEGVGAIFGAAGDLVDAIGAQAAACRRA